MEKTIVPGGIYVHIPFCVRKCAYCDFYSIGDPSLIPAFLDAILEEMALTAPLVKFPCDTLYLGGGTPSVLEPEAIARIIESARTCFRLLPDTEITIEANPGTVTRESLRHYRQIGINRINMGIQSFQENNLHFLGRIHSVRDAVLGLENAREAGFDNLGLDLIYALPGQSETAWQRDMEATLRFAPEHISCYMLTYEEGTPLTRRSGKDFSPLPDAACADMFLKTCEFLEAQGYLQYEISNFARQPQFRSRHNQKYWDFVPYIGLGPSAHSFLPPRRHWNHRSVETYIADIDSGRLPLAGTEILSREQEIIEIVYLGLRKREGIDIAVFEQKSGLNFDRIFGPLVRELTTEGFLEKGDAGRCFLSRRGMVFLDSITSRFVTQDF